MPSQAPYVNVALIEDAIERHYAAIRFSQPFITEMRDQVDAVIGDQEKSARLLRKQITAQLKELDTKEENLIDLAADSTLPRTKVKERLRDIASERRRLEGRLETANADLTDSAQLVNASLALLEQPDKLYRRCNDQQRRLLNQAIFQALYIEDEEITDSELQEPFGLLHAIQRDRATATSPLPTNKKATRNAGGPCSPSGVAVLLRGLHSGTCSSKTPRVELRGIEPLTFSMRTRRATNCATAPCEPRKAYQPLCGRPGRGWQLLLVPSVNLTVRHGLSSGRVVACCPCFLDGGRSWTLTARSPVPVGPHGEQGAIALCWLWAKSGPALCGRRRTVRRVLSDRGASVRFLRPSGARQGGGSCVSPWKSSAPKIGMDLGITTLAVFSDGCPPAENPKHYDTAGATRSAVPRGVPQTGARPAHRSVPVQPLAPGQRPAQQSPRLEPAP